MVRFSFDMLACSAVDGNNGVMMGWVLLTEYASVLEAEMAAARLRDVGLHVLTNSPATGVLGPGFSGAVIQGVRLLVPAKEKARARMALDLTTE